MTWAERPRSSANPIGRGRESFTLEEVRRLDAEAVRRCDGFEFRYHEGGIVTWREEASDREITVPVLVGVPVDGWCHPDGCACESCRVTATRASDPGSAKSPEVFQ
jgi:hypothetical protein